MSFLRLLEETVTNTTSNGFDDDLSNNIDATTISNITSAGAENDDSTTDFDIDTSTVIICLSWLLFMLYCCCQPRRGANTEQGDRIRRLARERWERERNRNCRTEQEPEKRAEVMNLCMRTKRVISKSKNGDLHLGPVEPSNTSTSSSNDAPGSPGLATLPVQKDEENNHSCNILDDDEDEEQACVICLDSFEVGDIVSWSRTSPTCQHVFHKDCIGPWLLERRQDECPSCRCELIKYNYDDPDTPVKENLENLLSISFDDEDFEEDGDGSGEGMFTIVQGLISRATRRASYALVGNTDSLEEEMEEGQVGFMAEEQESSSSSLSVTDIDLSTPSVFRRVASVGSASLAGRSISSLRHSSSSISNYLVMPRRLFPDKDIGDGDASSDMDVDVESGVRLGLEHGPYPLRRVVSDKGLSPRTPCTADSSMASSTETETMTSTMAQTPTDLPQLNHPFGSEIGLRPLPGSDSLSSGDGIARQRSFSFLAMRNVSNSYRRQLVPTSDDDLTESSLDEVDHNEEDGDVNDDIGWGYSSPTSSVHGFNDEDTSNLTLPDGAISPISHDSV